MNEPAKLMVPPRGEMSVKRLQEADPCPCKSERPFGECCRGELKEGMTPENTLHLLFEERDPQTAEGKEPLFFYAIMSQKMNGQVAPDSIVENIAKRLHSPPVARALDRLTWKTTTAAYGKLTMQAEPVAPVKELLNADGKPVQP